MDKMEGIVLMRLSTAERKAIEQIDLDKVAEAFKVNGWDLTEENSEGLTFSTSDIAEDGGGIIHAQATFPTDGDLEDWPEKVEAVLTFAEFHDMSVFEAIAALNGGEYPWAQQESTEKQRP